MYIESLESQLLSRYPAFVQLVKQCLRNAAGERPSAEKVLADLRRVRVEVEGEYGGSSMNFDIMMRSRVAKEMRIEELTQEMRQMEAERREAEGKKKILR